MNGNEWKIENILLTSVKKIRVLTMLQILMDITKVVYSIYTQSSNYFFISLTNILEVINYTSVFQDLSISLSIHAFFFLLFSYDMLRELKMKKKAI